MNWRPNFESMDDLGKVMFEQAKFTFTVEKNMENSHLKGCSHFKLNLDD